jgi:hypothetical protein
MPSFKIVPKEDIPLFQKKVRKLKLNPTQRFDRLFGKLNKNKRNRPHEYKVLEYQVDRLKFQDRIKVYGLFNGYGKCICEVIKTDDEVSDYRFLRRVAIYLYTEFDKRKHKGGYWFN